MRPVATQKYRIAVCALHLLHFVAGDRNMMLGIFMIDRNCDDRGVESRFEQTCYRLRFDIDETDVI